MPLVALDPTGLRLDLTDYDDADWDGLRASDMPLRCQGCRGPMHTAVYEITDPLPGEGKELRMFRHNPGAGAACRLLGNDESPAHMRLKQRLGLGARTAGWDVQYEVRSRPDCQADVVATNPRNGKAYALEAQLANLNMRDALRRHQLYEVEFGACTWTHTGARDWASQIPALKVDTAEQRLIVGGILTDLSDETTAPPQPVEDVVGQVLRNELRYIFLTDWGTYVTTAALASGVGQARQRRSRPRSVTGEHIRRFCDRARNLDPVVLALAERGFRTVEAFIAAHHHGLSVIREDRTGDVPQEGWDALALAHLHPALKTVSDTNEINAQLEAIAASRN